MKKKTKSVGFLALLTISDIFSRIPTFFPSPFFFLVIRSMSSKRMTCMSDGRPESSRLRGPSNTIWRRGETMSRSQGCLASGAFRKSGTTILGSRSRTEGHTRLRWISSRRSKFFSHFILSSSSRMLASSFSRIFKTVSFSCRPVVRVSISRNNNGIFIIC